MSETRKLKRLSVILYFMWEGFLKVCVQYLCQNPKFSEKFKIFKFTNINIKCSLTNHYLVIC